MNIPSHWQLVKLGDLCLSSQYGFTTSSAEKGNVRLIRTTDITGKLQVDWLNVPFAKTKPDNLEDFLLENGDILISRSGTVGVSSLIDNIPYKAIFASYLIRFKPIIVDSEYLYYYTKTENYWQQINENKSGNTISNVNATKLSNLDIPIPPLAEQKRIVKILAAKLNEYQKDFESAKNELAKMAEYRKGILEAAVTGKLTEGWRKINIKEKIITEKSVKETYRKKFDLPFNWSWGTIGSFAQCSRGRFNARPRNNPIYFKNGTFPFIQINNIPNDGGVVTSYNQTLNDKGIQVSKSFPKNTVVIAIVGATIGNVGILDTEMYFPDSIVGMNTNNLMSNKFLEIYLRHEKKNIRDISYSSGGQPNLRLELINDYPISIPPLDEQEEIVNRVEESWLNADVIEIKYSESIQKIEKLQQSVLQMAFNGEFSKFEAMRRVEGDGKFESIT